jgi:hypothetical protein
MKLAKSLLLGSAAGLMAVAGASAADLPVRAAAPAVDYVRVCNAYGTGFFFIPGTETCLRVSGSVRVDIDTAQQRGVRVQDGAGGVAFNTRLHNSFLIGGRSQINFDSRTATEMGLLRTLVTFDGAHAAGTAFRLPNAYIQLGGLTAGRVSASAFDYYTEATYGAIRAGSISAFYAETNALWYTAAFGQGVSATIALEQRANRRRADGAWTLGGQKVPDIIANLNVTQAWGGAQIAVAAHNNNPAQPAVSDRFGWAAMAGVNIKLPMLAPGSEMWLQGAYAEGAPTYTGNVGFATRRLASGIANAYLVGGSLRPVKSWSVGGGLRHNWTPQWQSNLHAAYGDVRVPNDLAGLGASATVGRGFNWWNIAANTIWRPVAGLQIGLEGDYRQQRYRQAINIGTVAAPVVVRQDGIWSAKLRIQRDF